MYGDRVRIITCIMISAFMPAIALAHESSQKPIWENLLVATFPILIIAVVFWLFLKGLNKGGKNINERLLDSNLEIAKELRRIADHLDKAS